MKRKCDKCNSDVYKRYDDWDFWMKINDDTDILQGYAIIRLCKSCSPPKDYIISKGRE